MIPSCIVLQYSTLRQMTARNSRVEYKLPDDIRGIRRTLRVSGPLRVLDTRLLFHFNSRGYYVGGGMQCAVLLNSSTAVLSPVTCPAAFCPSKYVASSSIKCHCVSGSIGAYLLRVFLRDGNILQLLPHSRHSGANSQTNLCILPLSDNPSRVHRCWISIICASCVQLFRPPRDSTELLHYSA